MKKKATITLSALIIVITSAFGQNERFTRSGMIEYQKTVNMYAIIQRGINKSNESFLRAAFESYKQQQPQFRIAKSTLTFAGNTTLFTPTSANSSISGYFNDPEIAMQNNIVFSDLSNKRLISKRKIYDEVYLLTDSVNNITWKLTDEVRDIAGYPCHRANGIMLDSVYVVAFYTDKIPVSGGPESFGGLPGMILQLALPHENVSWIAVRIEDNDLSAKEILPPKEGTAISRKQLINKLRAVFKGDFQKESHYLLAFLL